MTDDGAAAPTATVFKYESHGISRRKEFDQLCKSELMIAGVQTVGEGGETNLHSHRHLDGFWFVLKGRARFYTTDDEVLGDFGPFEGVHIPRNYPYWFERVGEENLEILQVESTDLNMTAVFSGAGDRVDHKPPPADMAGMRTEFAGKVRGDG
jgi:quercetin dioxygenase-like cupin family protein